jgi:hypothetical protein
MEVKSHNKRKSFQFISRGGSYVNLHLESNFDTLHHIIKIRLDRGTDVIFESSFIDYRRDLLDLDYFDKYAEGAEDPGASYMDSLVSLGLESDKLSIKSEKLLKMAYFLTAFALVLFVLLLIVLSKLLS